MTPELLYQILLAVSIIAVVCLVIVLWRLFTILNDVKVVSDVAKKRTLEVDLYIGKTMQSLQGIGDAIRGFIYSFDFIKAIREKFVNKGEKNEK